MEDEPWEGSRVKRVSSQNGNQQKGNRGPRGPRKSHILRNIILTIIAIIVVAGGAYAMNVYKNTKNAVNNTYDSANIKKLRNVSEVLSKGKAFSVLLMGTDTGELGRNYKGRTDSIMLVTVNPQKHTTTIMSLPRDQVTAVVGHEKTFPQKLNAAYSYGSAGTTIKTVEKWLNVPIDYYALVNMNALEKIVDQLNGISVTSPLSFSYDPDSAKETGDNYYTFTKGSTKFTHYTNDGSKTSNTMDGAAALAFSRMRYTDPEGDYGRQKRQRLVLQGIVDKAKKSPTTLVNKKFLDTISDNTKTDLTFNDMLTIISKYSGAVKKVVSDHAQGTGISLGGVSYELVSKTEQQRVTNVIRKSLGLKKATTGNRYGGKASSVTLNRYGLLDDESSSSSNSYGTSSTYGKGLNNSGY